MRCWLVLLVMGCTTRAPSGGAEAGVGLPDRGPVADVGIMDVGAVDDGAVDDGAVDAGAVDAVDASVDARPTEAPELGVPDAAPPGDLGAVVDAAPGCPAVGDCASVTPGAAVEHQMAPLEACAFQLRRTGDPAAARRLADDIAAVSRGYVPFTAVGLNRVGRDGITAGAAERLRNHPFEGFRWNAGDMDTASWYPQGITGISDATGADGAPARRLFVVSWYDARDVRPAKGARITLVDYSDPAEIGYRHLLLVVPRGAGGAASFEAVTTGSGGALHAGGIVWLGDLLYVADTTRGFRVFDLGRVIEVRHFDDPDRVGVADGRVDAHGYRYVVPQIDRYELTAEGCPIRFSFAGLDRSERPPLLVSGEYHRDDVLGRVARWPVGGDGWLVERGGVAVARDAVVGAQTRMQGALTWAGDHYISSSSQAGRLGRLYRTRPGRESSISAWVYGCEDLYYERHTDRIWTPSEHPGARDVVSIRRLPP